MCRCSLVSDEKESPSFVGTMTFLGHVVVGVARRAKAGQLIGAKVRDSLQLVDSEELGGR